MAAEYFTDPSIVMLFFPMRPLPRGLIIPVLQCEWDSLSLQPPSPPQQTTVKPVCVLNVPLADRLCLA